MLTTTPQTSMRSVTNLRGALTRLSQAGRTQDALQQPDLLTGAIRCDGDFASLCHPHQEPPAAANNGKPWTTWLVLGGRGAGKTRLGAEWVRAAAYGTTPYAERRHRHIALIGETEHDVREVMIEGVSGLLRISPRDQRPLWFPTRRRLEWPNGAVAQAFSAEDPEQLRGPQFDAAWCDELAKWRRAGDAFDMLQFGLRLGARPRQLITTTPRPTALIKRLIADPRTAVTRAATHANAAHLSPAFLDEIVQRYEGTRLGRQEILGEIIEDRPDALWSRAMIEACPRARQRRRSRASWSASIRRRAAGKARMPAASWRRAAPRTGRSMCWKTRPPRGSRPPAGRRARSRSTAGTKPTRWSPR